MVRLFHFSDDSSIQRFLPRPVQVPSPRPQGQKWLNGPLVWAIDEEHEFLYLFPRECPRILAWSTPDTKAVDRDRWLGGSLVIAYVESRWLDRLGGDVIHRYELPHSTFVDLNDAGMWVSADSVSPIEMTTIADLLDALKAKQVLLQPVETLKPLRWLWDTTLHVSGIRLRNMHDAES